MSNPLPIQPSVDVDYDLLSSENYVMNYLDKDKDMVFFLLFTAYLSSLTYGRSDDRYFPRMSENEFKPYIDLFSEKKIINTISSYKRDIDFFNQNPGLYKLVCFTLHTSQCILTRCHLIAMDQPQFKVTFSLYEEESFMEKVRKNGTSSFLFHGSKGENWYSILRIKNFSKTKYQSNGAANGSGVYLSDDINVSLIYTGNEYKIVGIYEVVGNKISYRARNVTKHFVVNDDSNLMLRYILFMKDVYCTDIINSKVSTMRYIKEEKIEVTIENESEDKKKKKEEKMEKLKGIKLYDNQEKDKKADNISHNSREKVTETENISHNSQEKEKKRGFEVTDDMIDKYAVKDDETPVEVTNEGKQFIKEIFTLVNDKSRVELVDFLKENEMTFMYDAIKELDSGNKIRRYYLSEILNQAAMCAEKNIDVEVINDVIRHDDDLFIIFESKVIKKKIERHEIPSQADEEIVSTPSSATRLAMSPTREVKKEIKMIEVKKSIPIGSKRLMKEYRDLIRQLEDENDNDTKKMIYVLNTVSDNLSIWNVHMKMDDPDNMDKDLVKDMIMRNIKHIELEIRFPYNYPDSPPFMRVVWPRFKNLTGHVTEGGSICIADLSNTHWNRMTSMEALIYAVKELMFTGGGRLDEKNWNSVYDYAKSVQSFSRALSNHGWT